MKRFTEIPHLIPDQTNYIKSQQEIATVLVSDSTSSYYESDPDNRRTSARTLMWKWEEAASRSGRA